MIGNPFFGKFNVFLFYVISYVFSVVLDCRQACGSAANKRVQNNIPLIAVELDEPVRQLHWKGCRVANLFGVDGWECPYAFCPLYELVMLDCVALFLFLVLGV